MHTHTHAHTRKHTHPCCVSTLPSVPPQGNRCTHVPGSGGLRAESPGHRGLPRERGWPCCSSPTSPRPPVGLAAVEEEAEGLRPPSRAAQPAGWLGGPSSGPLGTGGPPAPRAPPEAHSTGREEGLCAAPFGHGIAQPGSGAWGPSWASRGEDCCPPRAVRLLVSEQTPHAQPKGPACPS